MNNQMKVKVMLKVMNPLKPLMMYPVGESNAETSCWGWKLSRLAFDPTCINIREYPDLKSNYIPRNISLPVLSFYKQFDFIFLFLENRDL